MKGSKDTGFIRYDKGKPDPTNITSGLIDAIFDCDFRLEQAYRELQLGNGRFALEYLADNAGEVIQGATQVLSWGAEKYGKHNYTLNKDKDRVIPSALRHLAAIMKGEEKDSESGLPHLWHLYANCLFLMNINL